MNDKLSIKQNVNYLEYPMYLLKFRSKPEMEKYDAIPGYEIIAAKGMPSAVDWLIFNYLLLHSQANNFRQSVKLSMHKILVGCDISPTKERKERLKESLDKWINTTVKFQNTFYNGAAYESISLNFINTWKIKKEENKIEVTLNEDYLQILRETGYFKYISFTEMKHLRKPVAMRLYEILSKSFYQKRVFQIGAQKLARKITLQKEHYSHIKREIESAVKIINKKTDLNIKFETKKKGKNDGVFTFKKLQKTMLDHMQQERNGFGGYEEAHQENYERIEDYAAAVEELLSQFGEDERKSLFNEFLENHVQPNNYLLKKYKQEGIDSSVIQRTYHAFLKRKVNEQEKA